MKTIWSDSSVFDYNINRQILTNRFEKKKKFLYFFGLFYIFSFAVAFCDSHSRCVCMCAWTRWAWKSWRWRTTKIGLLNLPMVFDDPFEIDHHDNFHYQFHRFFMNWYKHHLKFFKSYWKHFLRRINYIFWLLRKKTNVRRNEEDEKINFNWSPVW